MIHPITLKLNRQCLAAHHCMMRKDENVDAVYLYITELYWISVFPYQDPRRAVDVFYDMLCYEKFIKKLAPLSFMACDVIRVIIYSPEGCLTSRIIVLSRVS